MSGDGLLARCETALRRALEAAVILIMVALAVVVVMGIGFRKAGAALVWYDEVASILLAWLTYYGAALAALKRAHIGFPGLVEALPTQWRIAAIWAGEVIVIGFFGVMAWVGWEVLIVLEGDYLISLPNVPSTFTQSVIPIGGALFIIAQLVSLPRALDEARRGLHHEIPPELQDT